jgi:hypothetical protein
MIKELKAASKNSYLNLFDSSKKNLKNLHNLYEKYRPSDYQ